MRSCHCRFILSAHYQRLDKVAIRGEKLLRCQGPNKEEGPRKKHTHTHTHTTNNNLLSREEPELALIQNQSKVFASKCRGLDLLCLRSSRRKVIEISYFFKGFFKRFSTPYKK